jgi:hypothetical protein
MRLAIKFDNQPMLVAVKINDVRTKRNLATELQSAEPAIAKDAPEDPFGRG